MSRGNDNGDRRDAMSKRRLLLLKAAVSSVAALAAVLIATVYAVDRLGRTLLPDACDVAGHRIVPAPNAQTALVTFEVTCDATTPFSTQVSLVPRDASFSREKFPPFFSIRGQHNLVVGWTKEGEIEIVVPTGEQVYRQEPKVSGIAITYK